VRDGQSRRPRYVSQKEALIAWALLQGCRIDCNYVLQFPCVANGKEHRVYHDQSRDLAIKITHPDCFGHSTYGEDIPATPLLYFRRLAGHNEFFGDDIRVLGVCGEEVVLQVITSQPWIPPSGKTTEEEIDAYFAAIHFQKFIDAL
jgi:hypothetical protein